MADPRMSTAGYNPQSSNIPSGYVPCEEKNMYPADTYPGTSTRHDEIIMTEIQPQESRPHKKLIDDDVLEGKDKPNDYKELAVLGCLFNFLFGLIALVMTFRSQESWKAGERSKAKGYGLASMAMSVFAIISTAIIIFVVVWLFSLGGKDTISM